MLCALFVVFILLGPTFAFLIAFLFAVTLRVVGGTPVSSISNGAILVVLRALLLLRGRFVLLLLLLLLVWSFTFTLLLVGEGKGGTAAPSLLMVAM